MLSDLTGVTSEAAIFFQNRYKSILCQEDLYLKELVRYIHLNPLRARLVGNITELDSYPFAGHGVIMGKQVNDWQSIDTVLSLFGDRLSRASDNYQEYIAAGAKLGKQPRLTGGGLIRSAGGWASVQQLRNTSSFQKSDERILGDGEFVESVLAGADERLTRHYTYKARGVDLNRLQQAVATLVELEPEEMVGASKVRKIVRVRILFSYFAVREMGLPGMQVSRQLKLPSGPSAWRCGRENNSSGGKGWTS